MSISVILVTNNSAAALPPFLESLRDQTYENWRLYVIDQGSSDETISLIRSSMLQAVILRNARNTGMASGLNQGTRLAMSSDNLAEYFFLADVGTVLHRLCFTQLVDTFHVQPSTAIIGPKIFQMFEENILEESLHERVQSDILFSSGVNWRHGSPPIQRGYNQQDQGQFDEELDVDYVMRQALIIRSDVLQKIRYDDATYIDPYLIREGEGLDLACRVRKLGLDVRLAPRAHAYRSCGIFRGARKSVSIYRQLFDQTSSTQHMLSVRNSILLSSVHLGLKDRILKFPIIKARMAKWAIWLLFYDRAAFGKLLGGFSHRSHIAMRRRRLKELI
jgi:GT2 family glycosyltransferase